jgi:glutamine cyclotransferase
MACADATSSVSKRNIVISTAIAVMLSIILIFVILFLTGTLAITSAGSGSSDSGSTAADGSEQYIVLEEIPHDTNAFTQGLTWDGERLFESTGQYGSSDIREIDPVTGAVLQIKTVSSSVFAEGCTVYTAKEDGSTTSTALELIQISWRAKRGFIYDPDTLELLREFTYDSRTTNGEGWGITYDAARHEFIVSDGSAFLHFWDATTLEETKPRIPVVYAAATTRSNGGTTLLTITQNRLNELELLEDGKHVLANVWQTDKIVKINILTGVIARVYDFSTLYENRLLRADVLNGISTTGVEGEYWVTGKYWPTIYRIKLLV